MVGFWLFVIFLIVLIGLLPMYPYSRGWGYYPSGIAGLILLGLIVLMWFGVIAVSWPWATPAYSP